LAILAADIPGLNDLSQAVNGPEITLDYLATLVSPILPPDYQLYITLADTLVKLRDFIGKVNNTNNGLVVNVGDFSLSGDQLRSGSVDFSSLGKPDFGNLTSLIPVAINAVGNIEDAIKQQFGNVPVVNDFFSYFDDKLKSAGNGAGFSFPLLDDPAGGVFKLLLGQDVDFVNFHFQFHLSASETQELPFCDPVVKARFTGTINSDVYFKIGYDTKGLRDFLDSLINQGNPQIGKLADGFYIDSTRDLLDMSGSISAGLAVDWPLPIYPLFIPPIPPIWPGGVVPVTVDASVNGEVTASDIQVKFNVSDPKFRFFMNLPSPIFLTKGTITAGFNFSVDAGVAGVFTKNLYNLPIAETTLLDLYKGALADPPNPITANPKPPPQVKVSINLSGLPVLHYPNSPIVKPNIISIQVNGDKAYFSINGSQHVGNQNFPPVPLANLDSVEVIGSDGPDYLTVDGRLNRPVLFEETSQADHVVLDDRAAPEVFTQYALVTGLAQDPNTLTTADLNRVSPSAFGGTDTMDIKFGDVGLIGLYTSNICPFNNVNIPALYNTSANLVLGTTINQVTVDTTSGGLGDSLNIYGKTVNNAGSNVLNIVDRDSNFNLASGPDTYTLSATYAGQTVSDAAIVRQKRQVSFGGPFQSFQYTATTTIHYSGVDLVNIKAGDMGNVFNVQAINPATRYNLTGGLGNDTFVLGAGFAQLGFLSGNINIDGNGGVDNRVVLDDSGDEKVFSYLPQTTYTITGQSVAVQGQIQLQGVTFNYQGLYNFQSVEHLSIVGGGGNYFNVMDTPLVRLLGGLVYVFVGDTTILGGKEFNYFNVFGTSGSLLIDTGLGFNQVVVGGAVNQSAGSLNAVHGDVTVRGSGYFYINDSSSTVPTNYVMDAAAFARVDGSGARIGGLINYQGFTVGSLTLQGGLGGNVWRIKDTPFALSPLLQTGFGGDTVYVTGTTGDASIDLQGGLAQTIYIGDATHSLDTIRGRLSVSGGDNLSAIVTDAASTMLHVVSIDANKFGGQKIERFERGQSKPVTTIQFGVFGRVLSSLTYVDGQAGDSIDILGNPTGCAITVLGNPAGLDEFGISAYTNAIQGPVTFNGQPNSDFAVYYDYFNASPQTYTLKAGGIFNTGEEVDRSGLAPVIFNRTSEIILYSASDAYFGAGNNVINVTSSPTGEYLNLAPSGRDNLTIGSKAPSLGGTLANIKGSLTVSSGRHDISLTLDDSGNTNPSPRTITLSNTNGVSSPGNRIEGLASNPIYWNLDETSSITILGGAANETFKLAGSAFLPAIRIDGGGGVNTLDYSAYNGLPGLVAWYPGEGNTNDVTGGNNGTLHGGVSFVPGKVGQAFSFNGVDGYLQAVNSFALEPRSVSLEAWVNSTSVGRNRYILSLGASGDAAASYALYTSYNGGLGFYVSDGTSFIESPDADSSIWDGNWHHVVGTYDGSMVRLYVDGVEIGNGTPTNLQINYDLPTSNDLFIGTYGSLNPVYPYFFNGLVDEPSVFNRALSPADIQKLFAAGSAGKSMNGGLVAKYSGDGNADDAIAGNNGTVLGGVDFVSGEAGQAFRFNGVDGEVRVPDSTSLEPSAGLTVDLWVNSSNPGDQTYLLSKGASGDSFGSYALDIASGDGLFFDVATSLGFFRSPAASLQSVFDGQWHHVTGTFDGQVVRLFVDGVEQGVGTLLPGTASLVYNLPTHNDLLIGNYDNGGSSAFNYHFNGLIDEVSIFSRALSASEIQGGVEATVGTGVYVNLQTGEATELRGGIANIQNVIGSPFDDILVGNGGNVLSAGGGRNLLIAGPTASTLVGGSGEDILIGGTTDYDQNAAALAAILNEWADPNLDYATRVANLIAGNGVPALTGKSSVDQMGNNPTVRSNGGGNALTGGDGFDFFFGNLNNDVTDWDPMAETFASI
jgi:hypothetical protein